MELFCGQGDGRTFHPACLTCNDCGASVAGGAVFTRGEQILCGGCGGREVLTITITITVVHYNN